MTRVDEPTPEGTVEHEGQVAVEHYTISTEDDVAVRMTITATTIGEARHDLPSYMHVYSYALTATVTDGSC
ncbi:hypothetical protein [Saccharopolyspora sp. NPDC002376]